MKLQYIIIIPIIVSQIINYVYTATALLELLTDCSITFRSFMSKVWGGGGPPLIYAYKEGNADFTMHRLTVFMQEALRLLRTDYS